MMTRLVFLLSLFTGAVTIPVRDPGSSGAVRYGSGAVKTRDASIFRSSVDANAFATLGAEPAIFTSNLDDIGPRPATLVSNDLRPLGGSVQPHHAGGLDEDPSRKVMAWTAPKRFAPLPPLASFSALLPLR